MISSMNAAVTNIVCFIAKYKNRFQVGLCLFHILHEIRSMNLTVPRIIEAIQQKQLFPLQVIHQIHTANLILSN